MINTNSTYTATFKTLNKGTQTSKLDNVTFKSSSFAARRPENYGLAVDGKDASLTPVSNYLSGLVASFLGNKNDASQSANKNSKHISYLA